MNTEMSDIEKLKEKKIDQKLFLLLRLLVIALLLILLLLLLLLLLTQNKATVFQWQNYM